MKVNGKHYRTIWPKDGDMRVVQIIDQRFLPHQFVIEDLRTVDEVAAAIKEMHVRGAGLIGATAGFGMYIAALESEGSEDFEEADGIFRRTPQSHAPHGCESCMGCGPAIEANCRCPVNRGKNCHRLQNGATDRR